MMLVEEFLEIFKEKMMKYEIEWHVQNEHSDLIIYYTKLKGEKVEGRINLSNISRKFRDEYSEFHQWASEMADDMLMKLVSEDKFDKLENNEYVELRPQIDEYMEFFEKKHAERSLPLPLPTIGAELGTLKFYYGIGSERIYYLLTKQMRETYKFDLKKLKELHIEGFKKRSLTVNIIPDHVLPVKGPRIFISDDILEMATQPELFRPIIDKLGWESDLVCQIGGRNVLHIIERKKVNLDITEFFLFITSRLYTRMNQTFQAIPGGVLEPEMALNKRPIFLTIPEKNSIDLKEFQFKVF